MPAYMVSKKSRLGLGLIIGSAVGLIAGLFASDKPGKKLRKTTKVNYDKIVKALHDKDLDKKVVKIFGQFTEDFKLTIQEAKQDLAENLFELQKTAKNIDRSKYASLLTGTVKNVQNKRKLSKASVTKLKAYLKADLEKFKKLNSPTKQRKTVKKSRSSKKPHFAKASTNAKAAADKSKG